MSAVELRRVSTGEQADFVAMLGDYLRELDAYELPWDPAPPAESYALAFDEDPDGQDIEWIEADGERAGFLISRVVPDWPDDERTIAEVMECYVTPPFRRRGVGRAAIEGMARTPARGRRGAGRGVGAVAQRGGAGVLGAHGVRGARRPDGTSAVSYPRLTAFKARRGGCTR